VGCQVSTTDNFQNPPPGPPATCKQIDSLDGCDGGSISYSCTGDRPDDGDADLVCSHGSPGPLGATLYCCAPYEQAASECAPVDVAGCGGVAIGFQCAGSVAPNQADPAIACSGPISDAADNGDADYCCNTIALPDTCAADPTVACGGIAAGYTCAGSAFTSGDFTCVIASAPGSAAGPDDTSYCCSPPST
jgi:hypothetical protein